MTHEIAVMCLQHNHEGLLGLLASVQRRAQDHARLHDDARREIIELERRIAEIQGTVDFLTQHSGVQQLAEVVTDRIDADVLAAADGNPVA